MIDQISKNKDDANPDHVEEIYLTEKQCIRWVNTDTYRPDIFDTPEGQVVLKGMETSNKLKNQVDCHNELRALVERALRPCVKSTAVSHVAPPPKPVRKLERPANAEWTFFCHADIVIGVHDEGTVVGRFIHKWPYEQYHVTPDGVLLNNNSPLAESYMAHGLAKQIHRYLNSALSKWVKRVEGRKMPVGMRRFKKAIDSFSPSGGGFEKE